MVELKQHEGVEVFLFFYFFVSILIEMEDFVCVLCFPFCLMKIFIILI